MREINTFYILTTLLCISSCGNKIKSDDKKVTHNPKAIQSWEWDGMDTINRMDFEKNKQGHWKEMEFTASSKTIQAVYTGEPGVQTKILKSDVERLKVAEGEYKDNKKEGLWKFYFPSGRLKDSIFYKKGVAEN